MSTTTYSELKASIGNWLNRDDLTAVIPDFIVLAEQQMARDIRHWRQEKRVETTLNDRYEYLPNDFLALIELRTDNNRRLTMIPTAKAHEQKTSGPPQHYRLTADQIEFFPAPDASSTTTLSMQYYAIIPALSDADPSNWVLTYAADAYLYGALMHSAPYLLDDRRVAIWAGLYQSAIEGLRRDNDGAKYGGPLKMGVPR